MIDPSNVTNYNRNQYELEEFFLFSLFVAGKLAKVVARCLDGFLKESELSPLNYIRFLVGNRTLEDALRRAKLGKYSLFVKMLTAIIEQDIDIKTCSASDLESIPGIGPKTARFFILHTRPNQRYAVLDVHVMRWLKEEGFDAPPRPKSNTNYAYWEDIFLTHFENYTKQYPDITFAAMDLLIWNYGVGKREKRVQGTFNEYLLETRGAAK